MDDQAKPQNSGVQPLLDKTLRWLEAQLTMNQEKITFEQYIYILKALRIASKDTTLYSKSLLDRVKQDLTLKVTALVDLPRKDPEAFLELYEQALGFDPELASELRNTVSDDIRKLQLQDGSIIGEHVQLAHILHTLNPKDPASIAAIKHTARLFEQRVLKNLSEHTPTQLYQYVKSLVEADMMDERWANSVLDDLLVRQGEDGGWGDIQQTLYAARILILINILVAGERVNRALRHIQSKLTEEGSLGDIKNTALYVITHYEYMAAGSAEQTFESNGLLVGTKDRTLTQLLGAAIRRAQNSLVAINLRSQQLIGALRSALETTPTLEALLIYSGRAETIPQQFKEPNRRIKLRLVETAPPSLLIVDRRLIVFTQLDDESLSSPKTFAVKVFDPAIAEKLATLLYKQYEVV